MLHLSPQIPDSRSTERLHPEPVTRLASLRSALRVVDEFGGGPAPDFDDEAAARWDDAAEPAKRCFDRRSAELIAVATAGLEAVSAQREKGLETSIAAMRVIAGELRGGLQDLKRLLDR